MAGIRKNTVSRRRCAWLGLATLILAMPAVLLLSAVAAFHVLDWLYPFPAERLNDVLGERSPMIRAADGSLVSWRVDRQENWRLPVRLRDVSPRLVQATIAVEDKRFESHDGVDCIALSRAAWQNMFHMRRISGASTLSMQTVRLLWQRPRRLSSKAVEMFRALQLERMVGKEGVLELYFNLAPYGGNIVGAEAASRRYFGKSAAGLTLGEASLLAGIPQSPSRLDPRRKSERTLVRREHVLSRMAELGMITEKEAEAAAREPIDLEEPRERPDLAHFTEWAIHAAGGDGTVVTTLNPDWQAKVESAVERRGRQWSEKGVNGPAVVVLSLKDSSILAYLGNSLDKSRPGRMVDGVRARRQPGSLLKPFIFATLADQGGITLSSRVYDLPAFWTGYTPKNMDREWRGEMEAGEALRESRNIPAVRQLARIGVERFAGVMAKLDLDPGQPSRDGLALALGAREQRLLNLANAYAALGRSGVWLPVKTIVDPAESLGRPAEGRRIWSPEAAWLTLYALSAADGRTLPPRAWKTGTSWNQRDAWAVVVTPEAVIGVWCGRPYGGGSGWVAGAEDALPLAFDVADALKLGLDAGASWPAPPGVEFMDVCAASGEAPGWNCRETLVSPVDRRKTGNRQCELHRPGGSPPLAGDASEKNNVAPTGKPANGRSMRIVSPNPGACYVLGAPDSDDKLRFEVESARSGEKLFWFVDGKLAGTTRHNEGLAWKMEKGNHSVTVTNGEEGIDRLSFSVVGLDDEVSRRR